MPAACVGSLCRTVHCIAFSILRKLGKALAPFVEYIQEVRPLPLCFFVFLCFSFELAGGPFSPSHSERERERGGGKGCVCEVMSGMCNVSVPVPKVVVLICPSCLPLFAVCAVPL